MRPSLNRILVKRTTLPPLSIAGVSLDDTTQPEKKAEGLVIAVGKGEHTKALELKKGDTVYFGDYAGEEVSVKDKNYTILYVGPDSESDLLLIL